MRPGRGSPKWPDHRALTTRNCPNEPCSGGRSRCPSATLRFPGADGSAWRPRRRSRWNHRPQRRGQSVAQLLCGLLNRTRAPCCWTGVRFPNSARGRAPGCGLHAAERAARVQPVGTRVVAPGYPHLGLFGILPRSRRGGGVPGADRTAALADRVFCRYPAGKATGRCWRRVGASRACCWTVMSADRTRWRFSGSARSRGGRAGCGRGDA